MKSVANRAMGAQIDAERVAAGLTRAQLAERSGVGFETLKRIVKGERDINVTQIVALSAVFRILPETLLARAVDRIEQMSEADDTTDDLDTKRKQKAADMTAQQIDQARNERTTPTAAQGRDAESDSDEPEAP